MNDMNGRPRFVGIDEAAQILGVSYSTVWESLRRGDFPVPSIQIGTRWRISRSALEGLAGVPWGPDGDEARSRFSESAQG
jgi:excisionase family DNA binding protein